MAHENLRFSSPSITINRSEMRSNMNKFKNCMKWIGIVCGSNILLWVLFSILDALDEYIVDSITFSYMGILIIPCIPIILYYKYGNKIKEKLRLSYKLMISIAVVVWMVMNFYLIQFVMSCIESEVWIIEQQYDEYLKGIEYELFGYISIIITSIYLIISSINLLLKEKIERLEDIRKKKYETINLVIFVFIVQSIIMFCTISLDFGLLPLITPIIDNYLLIEIIVFLVVGIISANIVLKKKFENKKEKINYFVKLGITWVIITCINCNIVEFALMFHVMGFTNGFLAIIMIIMPILCFVLGYVILNVIFKKKKVETIKEL